jgi:hypothetical protein
MKLAEHKKVWRTAKYLRKRKSKEERAAEREKRHARKYLLHLQTVEFPRRTLLQLLGVIAGNGPILAVEMAIGEIEDQHGYLSPEDQKSIQEARAKLAERRAHVSNSWKQG